MSDQEPAKGSVPCQLVRRPDPLPHLIPQGGICILAGSPLVGKTALVATMLRAFRDNTPVFGQQPNRVPDVGIVCTDRGWEGGAGQWFERAGFPDIKRYVMADDTFFDPRRLRKKFDRVPWLMEILDRLKLPAGALVVVDTIAAFLGGNLLDYDGVMQGLLEIRAGLRPRGLTAFCTAHSSKLKANKNDRYLRPIDQIAGSTAITGFSDAALYLASPAETHRSTYTLSWCSHSARDLTLALDRDAETGMFSLADGGDKTTTRKVLRLFPREGSVTTGALVLQAQQYPLSDRTVRRALDVLMADGLVKKLRKGLYELAAMLPDDALD